MWTGRAQDLELRAGGSVRDVVLRFVVAPSNSDATASEALALAGPVLDAGPGQPPIIARSAWAQGMAPAPAGGAAYGVVRVAFVHHTVNPNGYSSSEVPAMLRAIWAYHVHANGWRDIGYNFVIDSFGRTFEARAGGIDEPVVGAQAGGYNLASTGVAVLGDFSATPVSGCGPRRASAAARLEALAARRAHDRPSVDPRRPRRRGLQPLPGQRRRLAATDRRAPRRGLDRLSRGMRSTPSCPPSASAPTPSPAGSSLRR